MVGPVNFAAAVYNGYMRMIYYTAPWQTIDSSVGGINDGKLALFSMGSSRYQH